MQFTGVQWLVSEHKKCLSQLEHLRNSIADLHRWIDLINERGEAMYRAFAELRAHLQDIQKRIDQLHRANHDDRELAEKLRRELNEWQERCRKTNVELEDVRARYEKMAAEQKKMTAELSQCTAAGSECRREGAALEDRIDVATAQGRDLRRKLMDEERYREMVARANAKIAEQSAAAAKLEAEIAAARNDLQQCRVDVINAKHYKPPGYNRDTHVNLDMQMWVTHNQTAEEKPYAPLIGYKTEAPKPHKPVEYKPAPQRPPQVYTMKYTTTTTTPYTTTTTTTTTTTYTTTTTTTTSTTYSYYMPAKPSYQVPSYKPPNQPYK